VQEAHAAAGGVERRHRPRGAVVEEARDESPGRLGRDGRRAAVEEAGASHPSSAVRESERMGRSSRGSPNVQALVAPILIR
jgi:hypothetical protein